MSTKVKYLFEQKELKGMDYEKLKEFKIKYLGFLEVNPFPMPKEEGGYYDMIMYLKRKVNSDAIKIGPYQNISVFEAANRIASDLVIINGMLQLIEEKGYYNATFDLCLGTMHTKDKGDFTIYLDNGDNLNGEAFNVAPSFLKAKLRTSLNKWEKFTKEKLDVILINDEAFENVNFKVLDNRIFKVKNWEN